MFYFCSKENLIDLIKKKCSNLKRFLTNTVALLPKCLAWFKKGRGGGGNEGKIGGVMHKPCPKIAQVFSTQVL